MALMRETDRTPRLAQRMLLAPMVPVAVAVAGGVLVQSGLAWPGWLYPAVAVALVAGWALLRRGGRWPTVRMALLLGLAGVLGAWRIGLSRHSAEPGHLVHQLTIRPQIATLTGVVQTRPSLRQRAFTDFPGAMARDPTSGFVLRVESWAPGDGPARPTTGLVKVECAGPALHVEPGQRVRVVGLLRPMPPTSNPGQPDWRQAGIDKRLFAAIWLPHESSVQPIGPAGPGGEPVGPRWRDAIRLYAHGLLLGDAEAMGPDECVLVDGLVLGRRAEGADRVGQPFVRTGTYHYLAISGLHMGILAGFGWLVLRLLGVRPRRSALLVLLLVGVYCLMAEPRPPILRAGIMIGLVCVGAMINREVHIANFLAVAAVVLLMIDPGELFSAGFQLSFVVVAGLLLFTGPLYRWLSARLRGDLDGPGGYSFRARAGRLMLQATAVSTVAWLSGLPLVAYHFGRVYPMSVLTSLALWPLVWLILSAGFAKMLLAAVVPPIGGWLAGPLQSLASLLLFTVDAFDRLPGMSVPVARPTLLAIVIYYAYLLAWRVRPAWLSPRRLATAGLALAVVALVGGGGRTDRLQLTALDVGDGLSLVGRMPDGRSVLFDAGSLNVTDVGEQAVVPALLAQSDWRQPVRVDAAWLSHPHFDHHNGLPGLARRQMLGKVIVSDGPPLTPGGQFARDRCLQLLADHGVTVERASPPCRWRFGQATVEMLWPPPWMAAQDESLANDASQVMRLRFAGRTVLLTGDIGQFTQQRLLAAHRAGQLDLRADVLIMPHHGAVVANTDAFVDAVAPGWVVISSSRPNRRLVERCPSLGRPGRRVLVTAADGAVRVEVGPDGQLRVESAVGRVSR